MPRPAADAAPRRNAKPSATGFAYVLGFASGVSPRALVAATIMVLAGPSNEGKTTLLFLILLARATLGPPIEICGRPIEPAPLGSFIVLIEAGHGDLSAARKLVKSAGLLGLGDDALGRIIFITRKAVMLGSPAWKEIERMVAAGVVCDIAIDTWSISRDGNGETPARQLGGGRLRPVGVAGGDASRP